MSIDHVGEMISVNNRNPFLISNNDTIWLVKNGAIDVFIVTNQKTHLIRVPADRIICGFFIDANVQLVAVGVPDTTVVKISRDQFIALTKQQEHIETVKNWLESWIKQWLSISEDKNIITPDIPAAIKLGNLFPLLDDFHQQLLPCIMAIDQRVQADDATHLANKLKSEANELNIALRELAETIKIDQKEKYTGYTTGKTLFNACQLVAHTLDVTLPPMRHKEKATSNAYELEEILKNTNLVTREVSLNTRNWWTEDNGALLAFLKKNDLPVALLPTTFGGYELVNPLTRTRIPVTEKIAATLQKNALMFFHAFPATRITLKKLVKFSFTGCLKDIYRLIFMGILTGILGIAVPAATGILFNKIIPGNEYSQLSQTIVLLIIITIAIAIFQMVNALALLRIEGKIGISSQAGIIERLFNLPAPFFRQFTSGDLAQRAFATDSIMQLMTGTAQTAILGGIFSLFSLIYMFFINVKLALLATILVAIALSIFIELNYKRLIFERKYSALQGTLLDRVFQLLNGITKLRIAGAEIKAFVLWTKEFTEKISAIISAQRIANHLVVFNSVFLVLASLVIFGFIHWARLPIHTGSFLAFNTAFIQFATAILMMGSAFTAALNAIPLYERVKPILQTLPEVDNNKIDPGELKGQIEVSHLSFRYQPNEPLILKNISLQIEAGQFVALVGPSSSGKSTILRLLLGLEQPETGAIYYDGNNLTSLNAQLLRRQMGVVIQNAKLLPGDIFTNIAGSSSATLDDAWKAAKMAGFDEDIKAMPMGMHTFISEGSGTISGGQRQRLLIARALVGNPKILLFDEASSALDNLTQAVISKSLKELNVTRILIAHRLSTVIEADQIYVIDNGVVTEQGSFNELMKMNGQFAQLARRQLVSY